MKAGEIILNIAVNLGRLSRWVSEGKFSRTRPFLEETEDFISKLESVGYAKKFEKTFKAFKASFKKLKKSKKLDNVWAEDALTWANILTHRAKFA
ncbi:hypothetical protein A3A60_04960 [Candidatus Curtissbacteria bacterium RIFCSPLOWO2_01_FULL_42_26]|uniref:Uncharacterized protein n=1 Tax=Candidatus Curtissbacteria bacterium RIFCSPLOWO2_01_FULL_42_26 TaxID=1797729 RepID=A0A1F5I0G9_9BACT|nr:MAG: hypothetical protein A3A60_04960 [Candidatus Curtissbacteria bacterium RIFCSPLOWO2_01_FULL_42_26]